MSRGGQRVKHEMRLLFVSNYFPPEVNAPATRLVEHARVWVKEGMQVEVLTSNPHFPEGRVYDGYRNAFCQEIVDGIAVTRVPMYVTANEGTVKRTLSYISYMLSTNGYLRRLSNRTPDVVIATSPQFFCALGGFLIARRLNAPFLLEVRDLWPESIVAVGAAKDSLIIRCLERLADFLYKKADHIVVVTNAFKNRIRERGISPDKISVITNGADLSGWEQPLDQDLLAQRRSEYGLDGKFVAAYVGTIGMAHRADIMLEAAQRCDDPDIAFVVAGTGAARAELEAKSRSLQVSQLRVLGKLSKDEVRYLMEIADASVIHLKASPLFETVIPSKIFEAMATATPILLGVRGEAARIVEQANAGIVFEPENADALVRAVKRLKQDAHLANRLGCSGRAYVQNHFDRNVLARRYASIIADVLNATAEKCAHGIGAVVRGRED